LLPLRFPNMEGIRTRAPALSMAAKMAATHRRCGIGHRAVFLTLPRGRRFGRLLQKAASRLWEPDHSPCQGKRVVCNGAGWYWRCLGLAQASISVHFWPNSWSRVAGSALGLGHPSDRRPLNPSRAQRFQRPEGIAQRRERSERFLTASTQGFRMRAAGGMALFAAPRAIADVVVSSPVRSDPGGECASAPTWPRRAKGRQPAPGASRVPRNGQPAQRAGRKRRPQSAPPSRGAFACREAQPPARRAPRALEDVEKVLTACDRKILSERHGRGLARQGPGKPENLATRGQVGDCIANAYGRLTDYVVSLNEE